MQPHSRKTATWKQKFVSKATEKSGIEEFLTFRLARTRNFCLFTVIELNHCLLLAYSEGDERKLPTCGPEADGNLFCPPASVPPTLWVTWSSLPVVPAYRFCLPERSNREMTRCRQRGRGKIEENSIHAYVWKWAECVRHTATQSCI